MIKEETTDGSFVCLERRVPLELYSLAMDNAVAVRADNDGSNLHAAGDSHRFWATGMILRVRFLDGLDLAPRVMAEAAEWTRYANLELQMVDSGPAEIRVTFLGAGNWSVLGTDSLVPEICGPDEATMCLSELINPESSTRVGRVVRHEFGHALGLVHEHSSPAAGIRWDKPAVYAALGAPPMCWSPEQVDHNVFATYSATTTNYTDFDPESVMLYAIPPEWTLDRRTYAASARLSATDIAFIRSIYPGR